MSTAECKEEAIFAAARRIADSAARSEYLQEACGDDNVLRNRVSALLRVLTEDRDFLESPLATSEETTALMAQVEGVGTVLGPYRLLEQIGVGGMGLVFLAEQQQPVRRLVAVKIIKPGLDTREVVDRFEVERQALAMMDHPNIARMLDTGTTETGRPYFVMELVRGIPITDFCGKSQLPMRQRLDLFISACEGVQHAHQKGIIHRDIKPGNVLIQSNAEHSANPVPKVIDFGISTAVHGRLSESTSVSSVLQFVGTPAYMSPEQAGMPGQDIDTRSDIYSLGVLLYELLTGTCPFDRLRLRDAGYEEIRRIICEEDPPRPSVRLAHHESHAPTSQTQEPRSLDGESRRSLRSDLDWIVMKAIEKNAANRYESVGAMIADLRRFLAHEPIEACPPSVLYRLGKFARRRRSQFALIAVTASFLVMSGIALLVGYVLISRERNEVLRQRDLAEAANREVQTREQTIRDYLYSSDMQLAFQAYFQGDVQQAAQKLRGRSGELQAYDRRGFEWHYLQRLCESRPRELKEHHRPVFGMEFSRDGRWLASASGDFSLKLWDTRDWSVKWTQASFANDVNSASFSPDGALLATAEESRQVRVWNVQSGEEVARLNDFQHPVGRAYFTSDPNMLVATDVEWNNLEGHISLWNLTTRQRVRLLDHQRMLAINPDGTRIAVVSNDGKPAILSLPRLEQVAASEQTIPETSCGRFSNDGSRLAIGSRRGEVSVWDSELRSSFSLTIPGPQRRPVRDVAFSLDDRFLVCGTDRSVAWTWELASHTIQNVWRADGPIWSLDFSPDGASLVLGCNDGSMVVHKTANAESHRRRIWQTSETAQAVAMNSDASRIAVTTDHRVEILDASNGATLLTWPLLDDAVPISLAFARQKNSVWVGDDRGSVSEFDLETGRSVSTANLSEVPIRTLCVSPSGNTIATLFGGIVWDLDRRQQVRLMPVASNPLTMDRFQEFRDDNTILSFRAGTAVLLGLQPENDRTLFDQNHKVWFSSGAFSANKGNMALGTADGTILLTDSGSQTPPRALLGHRNGVIALGYSPDGRTLASGSDSGEVRLWNVKTAEPLCELTGLTGLVHFVRFSADSRQLIAAADKLSGGSEIIVWDATDGD